MNTHVKKTQAERSTETKMRLFDSTLECLREFGYHGTSLSRILKKSGVSRGAWSHHFTNKMELIAATAEYALNRTIEITTEWGIAHSGDDPSLADLFDFIWESFYTGRHRDIWLELNIACRTDRQMRDRLIPVFSNFHASLDNAWRLYFSAVPHSIADTEALMNLTINIFRGIAIQSIASDDTQHLKELRNEWLKIASGLISFKPKEPISS